MPGNIFSVGVKCFVLYVSLLTPAITTLANLSLRTGKFPARFKSAQVLPLLKKAGLVASQLQADI